MFAVAGATTATSASCASRTCGTPPDLLPQVRVHAMVGQRGEGRGTDEPLRRTRHHHPDRRAAQPEQAHEDAGLVRGDATGDAEQDPAAPEHGTFGHRHVPPVRRTA